MWILASNFLQGESSMVKTLSFILAFIAAMGIFVLPAVRAASDSIPPGEAGARAALDKSPRHHEWVNIQTPGPQVRLDAFLVYPERKDKAPVVIVIHEIFGLTDWIRAVADKLAEAGFIAIAPDLLTGRGPDGGGTDSFADRDAVVKAVRELSPARVDVMLNAVKAYATALPAATGRFGTVGFCWGGTQSFQYATVQPSLGAAVVYYGTSPELDALSAIHAPVLGLYGGDDARVVTTVGPAEIKMKELHKIFIPHIYEGAGHGFLRAQADRNGANLKAARSAWPETIKFLKKNLE